MTSDPRSGGFRRGPRRNFAGHYSPHRLRGAPGLALFTILGLLFGFVIMSILWIAFFIWFSLNLRDRNVKERDYQHLIISKCFDLRQKFDAEIFKFPLPPGEPPP
jgi:hypothetical protein